MRSAAAGGSSVTISGVGGRRAPGCGQLPDPPERVPAGGRAFAGPGSVRAHRVRRLDRSVRPWHHLDHGVVELELGGQRRTAQSSHGTFHRQHRRRRHREHLSPAAVEPAQSSDSPTFIGIDFDEPQRLGRVELGGQKRRDRARPPIGRDVAAHHPAGAGGDPDDGRGDG